MPASATAIHINQLPLVYRISKNNATKRGLSHEDSRHVRPHFSRCAISIYPIRWKAGRNSGQSAGIRLGAVYRLWKWRWLLSGLPASFPIRKIWHRIATSIDALAVGVTFAFMDIALVSSVTLIGVTTFLFSAAGIKVGSLFGMRYKNKAERIGGAVLILIGLKIFLEGLGVL